MIEIGTHVRTARHLDKRDFTDMALAARRPNVEGEVIKQYDSHGECYKVQHADGTMGWYDPDELIVLGDFAPLAERYPAIDADPIRVSHASHEKWSPDSAYKAHCPACKTGLLLVTRHPQTLHLMREDRCISCAQRVVYTDDEIGGEALPKETE